MKHQWLAYAAVAILSIGAGVAIAGLPDSVPESEAISPPSTTGAPQPTAATTTTAAPTTTAVTTTTEHTTTTTAQPTTTKPATTTTTTPRSTTTTEPDEPTTTVPPLPGPADVVVAVANGSGRAGVAGATATVLAGLGYQNVAALNGLDRADTTVVYYAAGSEATASRLATDLGLVPTAIAPIEFAPRVLELGLVQLLVYAGTDRS